jgi:hypothetical protein
MQSLPTINVQVRQSQVATWASELALDDRFNVFIQELDITYPDAAKIHPMYSLDYGQVATIVVQSIGTLTSLVAIYDKLIEVYRKNKKNSQISSEGKFNDEPVIVINGKMYLLQQISRDEIVNIDRFTNYYFRSIDNRLKKEIDNIKLLFLAANPKQMSALALDIEIREITQKIRLSDARDRLNVISTWAVRPDDLLQYLNEHKPQIVHFSGHGSSSGEIVLVDNNGNENPVKPHALKALFSTLRDNIEIVLLNACYSKIQGQAINQSIDFVIGMDTAIGDKTAIVFAASFYRALGFNRTVQEAFDQAKTAIMLEGIPEENTPMLLVREGADPNRRISGIHQT